MTKEYSLSFTEGRPTREGVRYDACGVNFCASFLHPENGVLHLASTSGEPYADVSMKDAALCGSLCAVRLEDGGQNEYIYSFTEDGLPKPDLYARKIRGGVTYAAPEGPAAALSTLRIDPENLIFYKLHVRGYTKADPSVPEKERGTFAGLIRKIPYLLSLGINALECMPLYTFSGTLDNGRVNFWGYSETNFYFAPNAEYAMSDDPDKELRMLIDALHGAGILFIPEFYIPSSTPVRLVTDAAEYWSQHYQADGFHFVGKRSAIEELMRDPFLAEKLMVLDSVDEADPDRPAPRKYDSVLAYQHDFRSTGRMFLKGTPRTAPAMAALLRTNPRHYHVINYIAGHNGFTLSDLVSYNRKHNEANGEGGYDGPPDGDSWNCGQEGKTDSVPVLRLRRQQKKNAMLFVFLAQGIPLLYAGDEFGNSQDGNNNAYSLDNPTGWTDWSAAPKNREFTDFVKSVIRFRKENAILRHKLPLLGGDPFETGFPDLSFHGKRLYEMEQVRPSMAVLLNGRYAKKGDPLLYIVINMHWEPYPFAVPELKDASWECVIRTGREPEPRREAWSGGELLCALPHTITIYREKRK